MRMVNINDSYKFYKKKVENPVGIKVYIAIVVGFIKFMINKVFEGWSVQLSGGESLGVLTIRGTKSRPVINKKGHIKGIAPDWGKTRKLWAIDAEKMGLTLKQYIDTVSMEQRHPLVHCFNEHSNGITYKIVWLTDYSQLPNKLFYGLQLSRENKRRCARLSKEGKEYYVKPERLPKHPVDK